MPLHLIAFVWECSWQTYCLTGSVLGVIGGTFRPIRPRGLLPPSSYSHQLANPIFPCLQRFTKRQTKKLRSIFYNFHTHPSFVWIFDCPHYGKVKTDLMRSVWSASAGNIAPIWPSVTLHQSIGPFKGIVLEMYNSHSHSPYHCICLLHFFVLVSFATIALICSREPNWSLWFPICLANLSNLSDFLPWEEYSEYQCLRYIFWVSLTYYLLYVTSVYQFLWYIISVYQCLSNLAGCLRRSNKSLYIKDTHYHRQDCYQATSTIFAHICIRPAALLKETLFMRGFPW